MIALDFLPKFEDPMSTIIYSENKSIIRNISKNDFSFK